MKNHLIWSDQSPSVLLKEQTISNWTDFLHYIKMLPYGRNADRNIPALVLKEKKGSCSSKHALIKIIADQNHIPNVALILAYYRMNKHNTPGTKAVLEHYKLHSIPEAHCYVKIDGKRYDFTHQHATIEMIKNDIISEQEMEPAQCGDAKIISHKDYINQWCGENTPAYSPEEIWKIREECIRNIETSESTNNQV